jgi:hypothetical protein
MARSNAADRTGIKLVVVDGADLCYLISTNFGCEPPGVDARQARPTKVPVDAGWPILVPAF